MVQRPDIEEIRERAQSWRKHPVDTDRDIGIRYLCTDCLSLCDYLEFLEGELKKTRENVGELTVALLGVKEGHEQKSEVVLAHIDLHCDHQACWPPFDEVKARMMTAAQVREVYPRFVGVCPTCGENVIAYASMNHYHMGDW